MSSEISAAPARASAFPVIEDILGRAFYLAWLFFAVKTQLSSVPGIIARSDGGFMLPLELLQMGLLIAFSVLCIVLTFIRRPAKQVASGWEPRVTSILGSYLLLVIPLLPAAHMGPAWTATSVVVMATGLAASLYALAWLGRSFSMMAVARKLVTAGPYSVVRHPLYACETLMMIGVVMANFSLTAILVAIAVVALLYKRMLNEERVLLAAFPEEYATYMQRVPRIVPRIFTRA